jgi:glycosyltransferase involved in cell wall biosynthesis
MFYSLFADPSLRVAAAPSPALRAASSVIAYRGSETAAPITDAGVVLVSLDRPDDLNVALVRVLSDAAYRMDLAARSRAAYQTHFAWPVIAARFSALLKTADQSPRH